MPIEFRCPSCGKLLRTPDGTGGKQAKCPQCGALSEIPAASTASPASAGEMPPREPDFRAAPASLAGDEQRAGSPYQASAVEQTRSAPGPVTFQPTRIDLGDVLNKTWEIYKANLGACIVGVLLTNVCAWLVSMIITGLLTPLMNIRNGGIVAAAALLMFVGFVAMVTYFYLGLVTYMLAIARGQPARIGDLFRAGPILPGGAMVYGMLWLGLFAGFIMLLVPGVIFGLFFGLAPIIFVDRQAAPLDCFRMSAAAMQGNKLTVFLLMLLVSLIAAVLGICTCGLASIFTAPFGWLGYAVVYLTVTGQPTAMEASYPGSERGFAAPGTQPSF